MFDTKKRCVIVFIVGLLIAAVTGYFYVSGIIRSSYLRSVCTERTSGQVYTYRHTGRSSFFFKDFGAAFVVNDITYHATGVDGRIHDYGDVVTVHYDPSDPRNAYSGTDPARLNDFVGILLIFSGAMTCLAAVKSIRRL